jgi:hypothetical protein
MRRAFCFLDILQSVILSIAKDLLANFACPFCTTAIRCFTAFSMTGLFLKPRACLFLPYRIQYPTKQML